MKKLIFTVLLITVFASTIVFAGDKRDDKITVPTEVQSNFKYKYEQAENVSWSVNEKFQKAAFTLKGVQMTAFYNFDGEHIATTQFVSKEELPVATQNRIAKEYQGYSIGEIVKYNNGETIYFIDIKNNKEELLVRAMSNNHLYFFQRIK